MQDVHMPFSFETYRITRNFRENLIFANDLKTRKYVSAKNCALKENLEVGTGMIFAAYPV